MSLDAIYDKEECKKTLKAIKKVYPTAEDKTATSVDYTSRPKGCVFEESSKDLKFNTNTGSSGYSNTRQICKDETEEEGDNTCRIWKILKF